MDNQTNGQQSDDALAPYRLGLEMGAALVTGGTESLFNMGMALIANAGGESEMAKGLACVEAAAMAGDAEAMHVYAQFIAEGVISGQDLGDALIWALKALKGGFPDDGLIDMIQEKMGEQNN